MAGSIIEGWTRRERNGDVLVRITVDGTTIRVETVRARSRSRREVQKEAEALARQMVEQMIKGAAQQVLPGFSPSRPRGKAPRHRR